MADMTNIDGVGRTYRWRRELLVSSETSDWFARAMGIAVVSTWAILGGCAWLYHRNLAEWLSLAELERNPELLEQYLLLSAIGSGIVAVIAGFNVLMVSLFLFQRVAGPIFSVMRHMQQVIDGEPVTTLSLRKDDQLRELCDTYNQLLHSLDVIEPKPPERVETPPAE